jgi:hippurate hydrolase
LQKYQVEAIFALHLWPGQEAGTISSRKLEMLSRCSELTVDIYGKPAHVAKAWESRDAMAAAWEFYSRCMALEQSVDPSVRRLLKFGKMTSGTVRNIISGHTRLEGTLRTYQDEWFDRLYQGILEIAAQVEENTGCRVEVKLETGYLAVINHPQLYDKVRKLVEFTELPEPSMISEDFSCYQRQIPGVFFFLGLGDTPALHNDCFDFDEKILIKGADFFWELAKRYC